MWRCLPRRGRPWRSALLWISSYQATWNPVAYKNRPLAQLKKERKKCHQWRQRGPCRKKGFDKLFLRGYLPGLDVTEMPKRGLEPPLPLREPGPEA